MSTETAVIPAAEGTSAEPAATVSAPAPKLAVQMLPCRFEGCNEKIHPSKASVPSLKAVRQAQGSRPVKAADLAEHVFCARHSHLARKQGLHMFSYLGSLAELKRRETEETTAVTAFGRYGQMLKAFDNKKVIRNRPAQGNFGRR